MQRVVDEKVVAPNQTHALATCWRSSERRREAHTSNAVLNGHDETKSFTAAICKYPPDQTISSKVESWPVVGYSNHAIEVAVNDSSDGLGQGRPRSNCRAFASSTRLCGTALSGRSKVSRRRRLELFDRSWHDRVGTSGSSSRRCTCRFADSSDRGSRQFSLHPAKLSVFMLRSRAARPTADDWGQRIPCPYECIHFNIFGRYVRDAVVQIDFSCIALSSFSGS
jgi:hypothetical protein